MYVLFIIICFFYSLFCFLFLVELLWTLMNEFINNNQIFKQRQQNKMKRKYLFSSKFDYKLLFFFEKEKFLFCFCFI
jgi:hypothetical protein